jgi:16S rRNA (guanine966-N2)-methyltransferase
MQWFDSARPLLGSLAMRTEVRIVAGSLRGRKLAVDVNPAMRPTPQMVREALFSILGNAVPGRPFVDIFAGTGVVGLEAISRGASLTTFVERDNRLAQDIDNYLRKFNVSRQARLFRTDAYRWVAAWRAPKEPANIFLSPPFPDLTERPEGLLEAIRTLQDRVADESVIILQSELGSPLDDAPELLSWERRKYGRNILLLWQKGVDDQPSDSEAAGVYDAGVASDEPTD